MSETNKKWLKFASVINWIFAIAFIFVGLAVVFDFFNMRDMLEWYVSTMVQDPTNPTQYSFVRFLVMAEALFACVINIYAGALYWSLSKKNHVVAGAQRILITTGLFQIFFTANIISPIVAFCIAAQLNKNLWEKRSANNFEYIAYEIEKLRVLKDKGVITEEEWQARFDYLLTQYSKEKDTKK